VKCSRQVTRLEKYSMTGEMFQDWKNIPWRVKCSKTGEMLQDWSNVTRLDYLNPWLQFHSLNAEFKRVFIFEKLKFWIWLCTFPS
jgi:hypothetical protein